MSVIYPGCSHGRPQSWETPRWTHLDEGFGVARPSGAVGPAWSEAVCSVRYKRHNPRSRRPSNLCWGAAVGADGCGWGLRGESSLLLLCLRIRKVWQKRKCGVKYGCLTISHSTVSIQPHVNRRGKSGVLPGRLRPRDGTWWHTVYPREPILHHLLLSTGGSCAAWGRRVPKSHAALSVLWGCDSRFRAFLTSAQASRLHPMCPSSQTSRQPVLHVGGREWCSPWGQRGGR